MNLPLGIQLAIAALVGLGLGFIFGWLYSRGRAIAPDDRLANELRQQLGQREAELNITRGEVVQIKTSLATAQANQASAEKLLAEQRALHDRVTSEAKEAQGKALADLREAFQALSAEALSKVQPEFLQLATQKLAEFQASAKGDLAQRQEAIKTLVEPLKQQLETYQKQLQQSETEQNKTLGDVQRQLATLAQSSQSLAQETQQFRMVLRSNQARGRWGEETLRRVVEAAGMSAHCDFVEQSKGDEGKPDLIVKLPGERVIIVDAKVPDFEFLEALDEADTSKRSAALVAHAAKLKNTMIELAKRDYPRQFPNALDYVVLFLPAESLFSAALEGDRDLIVWAVQKRILLTTPASLIALLRSVSVSWQQHAQTENARAIAEAAQELFTRVAKFTDHLERIRDGLSKANNAFNDAVGSYERMVRPSGEKLLKLGGGAGGKALADVEPIEATLRLPPV